jgi:hypothetical protein
VYILISVYDIFWGARIGVDTPKNNGVESASGIPHNPEITIDESVDMQCVYGEHLRKIHYNMRGKYEAF